MGLLDGLFAGGGSGGGLLDFLRQNALNQQFSSGLPSDQAQYGGQPQYSPPIQAMAPPLPQQQNAQPSPMQANAQMPPQQPPPVIPAQPTPTPAYSQAPQAGAVPPTAPATPGLDLLGRIGSPDGLIARLRGTDSHSVALQAQNQTLKYLVGRGVDPTAAQAAIGNPELMKSIIDQMKPKDPMNLGQGYILPQGATKATRLYEPDETTPTSVREYKFYKDNLPAGQQAMPYDVWSTAKARAGATNIANNIDMNSGQTYDKQLAEGLGKSHAALANGVEDAQTRARDIAAMQGAIDAIQKNGGSTGGLGQQQALDLQKTINSGANALGIDKPFSESDLADKEFLTKFNRSMAGAQAKGAVGARVTNFEMGNFLKANPGLDMSVTGNQRLLGIQGQIEQRNIAVGNAIRDATAESISNGSRINPVTVQKIIKDYDEGHHIKDVVTGQDLTQSYALPEFQNAPSNQSMANAHTQNLKTMEKTIGNVTYEQRNGQWFPKAK